MTDDRDRRRPPPPPPHVRAQTAGPVDAIPEPGDDFDDFTGKYEGAELDEMRARRSTAQNLSHLARKHDRLERTVQQSAAALAVVKVQLDGQDKVLDEIRRTVHRNAEREHVTLTAQVELETATAKARIENDLDKRKSRRAVLTKVIAGAVGLLVSGGFIHWLLSRL